MSTNSTIAVALKDGSIRQVYCHWDGYIEHNGETLLEHYNSQELAELVTSIGDISYLAEKFSPDVGQEHSFENPAKGVTLIYRRDRKDDSVDPTVFQSLQEYYADGDTQEYNYLFDQEWLVRQYDGTWSRVKHELARIEEDTNA